VSTYAIEAERTGAGPRAAGSGGPYGQLNVPGGALRGRGIGISRSADGPRPDDMFPKAGLTSYWHHQHHAQGAPDQLERHETPDPVRSSAVEPRFHCVRQQTELHDELTLTGHTELVVLM
jgi:hypothetical protein